MRRWRAAGVTATVAMCAIASGCASGDDDDDAGSAADLPVVPSVVVPVERLTPFCEAMIGLGDQLETDPPDDANALILDTYLTILDEVPTEIETEFRAVIADLQSDAPTSTTEPPPTVVSTSLADGTEDFDAEGRLPGDSPSERVNDYVLFACRDSGNNPGPPATEPLDEVVIDDE